MGLGEAVDVFTKLTIGDGLVSQVPAFLISLAAGLIVTRSSSDDRPGPRRDRPALRPRRGAGVAAAFLALLAFTALPKVPLLTLAGGPGGAGRSCCRRPGGAEASDEPETGGRARPEPAPAACRPSRRRSGWKTCSTSTRWSWRSAIA